MLVTKDNLSLVANMIRESNKKAYLVVFGKEDSYALVSEYTHLYSCNVHNKDFKIYHPELGYNHDIIETVEQNIKKTIDRNNVIDCCLVFVEKHGIDLFNLGDVDVNTCWEKALATPSKYDWGAIEKAERQPFIL